MKKLIPLIALLILALCTQVYAQNRKYGMNTSRKQTAYRGGRVGHGGIGIKRYSTVGLSLNAMNYFGDITPTPSRFSTDVAYTKPGIGITYSKVFHPQAAWRFGLNYGTISGDDFNADNSAPPTQYLYLRNLHFKNSILELSWGIEFNLIPNNGGANNRFPLNPYLFLGIAVFKHNPQAMAPEFDLSGNRLPEAGQWVDLQPLGTEGQNLDGGKPYSLIQLALPVGLGVKVRLPNNFDAHFEIGFRQLFTDYLDDVGGPYPNLSLLDSDLARAMSERSGETTAVLAQQERIYNDAPITSTNWGFKTSDGSTVSYRVGGNYGYDNIAEKGGVRGSSAQKDLYIITQLRLVYIFGQVSRKKAKFR
ncbi:DUF6089 family protein [Reichenbachiella sp. MALMAid0571]|uniref:DUF6089 family protein n=1 Tax=Reichenbachiella sp. MALMAid0571 TaxID=3143939 RepID=UPI0032DE69AA